MNSPVRSLLLCCVLLALLTLSVFAQAPVQRNPPHGVPVDAELFNGKWYKLYNEAIRWNTARGKCITLGGQLAVVPDEVTWVFLKGRVQKSLYWLGATDENSPGNWKWIDGTPFTFKAWLPSEPNNSGGKEHYLTTWSGGWNDVRGDGKFPGGPTHVVGFVCEWKDK